MKKLLGKNGIIIVTIVVLVSFYAFTLVKDYNQEFEEIELPEVTYEVVSEKVERLLKSAKASPHYDLTDEMLILGEALNTYYIQEGTFHPTKTWKYYPVFQGNYVKGMVTARSSSTGEIHLEYSTFLVEEASECYLQEKACCFVIDEKSVWLVTEEEARQIFVTDHRDKEFGVFDETMKNDSSIKLMYVSK